MRLKNKVAVITGGNSGIGLATARLFLGEGAKVAITGRNAKTLAAAAEQLGGDVLALQADTTDIPAMEKAFAEAAEKLGEFDVVFANAGVAGDTPLGKTTLEQFETIVRVNFTGVFFTVQAALPYLNDGGSVILNGSVHAVLGIPGASAYAGTKGAVRAMTRNLASSLRPAASASIRSRRALPRRRSGNPAPARRRLWMRCRRASAALARSAA